MLLRFDHQNVIFLTILKKFPSAQVKVDIQEGSALRNRDSLKVDAQAQKSRLTMSLKTKAVLGA